MSSFRISIKLAINSINWISIEVLIAILQRIRIIYAVSNRYVSRTKIKEISKYLGWLNPYFNYSYFAKNFLYKKLDIFVHLNLLNQDLSMHKIAFITVRIKVSIVLRIKDRFHLYSYHLFNYHMYHLSLKVVIKLKQKLKIEVGLWTLSILY